MKKTAILTALLAFVLLFDSCKKDDDLGLSAEQMATQKLSTTWKIASVKFDDGGSEDRSSDFVGFTLTIDENMNYTTTNSADYGPFSSLSSGAWSFTSAITDVNASAFQIERSADGLIMDVAVSDTNMTLIFNFVDDDNDGMNDGRGESVTGEWTFQFDQ